MLLELIVREVECFKRCQISDLKRTRATSKVAKAKTKNFQSLKHVHHRKPVNNCTEVHKGHIQVLEVSQP